MPVITTHREFGKGKRYDNFKNNRTVEINSSENKDMQNAQRSNSDSESEPNILTRELVDEKFKKCIAPLTKQLEDLTRLMQRMSRAHQSKFPSTVSTSANFSTTGMSVFRPTKTISKINQIRHQKLLKRCFHHGSWKNTTKETCSNKMNLHITWLAIMP